MNESIYLQQRQPQGRRVFLIIFAVLAVIFFSSRTVLSYYVDALWFGSLGHAEIFRKTISLQGLVSGHFSPRHFLSCTVGSSVCGGPVSPTHLFTTRRLKEM